MTDPRTHGPGARWPLRPHELDDVEMLEMTRDDEGRWAWKSQTAPSSPDAFRVWMPKRRSDAEQTHGEADGDTSPPVDQPLPTRLDMSGAPPVSLAEMLPDLWPIGSLPPPPPPPTEKSSADILPVVISTVDPAPDVDVAPAMHNALSEPTQPPMRTQSAEPRGDPTPPQPAGIRGTGAPAHASAAKPAGALATIERLALVAAGFLMGTVLTLVWGLSGNRQPPGQQVGTVSSRTGEAGSGTTAVERSSAGEAVTGAAGPGATTPVRRPPAPSTSTASGRVNASPDRAPAAPDGRSTVAGPQVVDVGAASTEVSRQGLRADGAPRVTAAAAPPARSSRTSPGASRRAASSAVAAALPSTRVAEPGRRRRPPPPRPRPVPPAVLEVVRQYAVAYSRMDARATQAVWPTADRQLLASTFNGLREQRLTLSSCRGLLVEVGATVSCRGTLRYRPRLGEHSTRTRRGTWRFALAPAGDTWRIDLVTEP